MRVGRAARAYGAARAPARTLTVRGVVDVRTGPGVARGAAGRRGDAPGVGSGLRSRWTAVTWRNRALWLHHVEGGPTDVGRQPLLLVHGMASSWRQWRSTMQRLLADMPTAALDLPGFGMSQQPRRPLQAQDYADICELWCGAVGYDAVRAVGHSFGGAVVADWAGRHPRRLERVGLIAPALVYHPWYQAGVAGLSLPVVGPSLAGLYVWLASTERYGPRFFGHIVNDLAVLAREERRDLQWGCRSAREMRRALNYYRFTAVDARLRAVAAPVLIGWGRDDRVVPYADAAVFTAHLRRAQLTTWERCGHLPMFERRAECDRFLREVWEGGLPLWAAPPGA